MQFFHPDLVAHVWSKLEGACKSGEGITNSRLTEACGFSKEEEDCIRLLVKREFIARHMVEVVKGSYGGYYLTGVERVKTHASQFEITDEYKAKVKDKLDFLLNMPGWRGPVSVGMLTGHLGEFDQEKVRAALVHMASEYEVSKGSGIKRRKVEPPKENPKAA